MCMHAQSPGCVQLFVTPWTGARQAPLPMGFRRQEYWTRLPVPHPGDLPDLGTPSALAWAGDSLPLNHLGSPIMTLIQMQVEHSSKTLFNSLINEVAISSYNQFNGESILPHLCKSIMSAKINLEIGAKLASLVEEWETVVLIVERICFYPWKSIDIAISCLKTRVIKSL